MEDTIEGTMKDTMEGTMEETVGEEVKGKEPLTKGRKVKVEVVEGTVKAILGWKSVSTLRVPGTMEDMVRVEMRSAVELDMKVPMVGIMEDVGKGASWKFL